MIAVAAVSGDSQFGGGLNGGTTNLCHLLVWQFFAYAGAVRSSAAIIFVDIIGAFASVARRIAIPDLPEPEGSWRRHLAKSGLSHEQANGIVDCAMAVMRWQAGGASPHTIAILTETHRCTWFSVDCLAGISRFVQRTLAGTSLAEIILIVSAACVTRQVDNVLADHGLLHTLPCAPAAEFLLPMMTT